jgi:hypothetical protein
MWKDDLPPNRATTTEEANREWEEKHKEYFGYVPNYPPPLPDTNPFNLIDGNENKLY